MELSLTSRSQFPGCGRYFSFCDFILICSYRACENYLNTYYKSGKKSILFEFEVKSVTLSSGKIALNIHNSSAILFYARNYFSNLVGSNLEKNTYNSASLNLFLYVCNLKFKQKTDITKQCLFRLI